MNFSKSRKLRRVWPVKRRVFSLTAHAPVRFRFLVDDLEQLVPDHQHANLALGDARHQALIDQMRTLAGEVFRKTLRHTGELLILRTVDAKLHELANRVVLRARRSSP